MTNKYRKHSVDYGISKEKINQFHSIMDKIIDNFEIPDLYPDDILDTGCWFLRDDYTTHISWCLASKSWLDPLYENIKGSTCVELYAGKGLISKYLQDKGLDITPYDDYSWINRNKRVDESEPKYFADVICKDAGDAIREFDKNIDYIIMSWVPYEDTRITGVLNEIRSKYPNAIIIWIGEDYGGCTGCDEFFEMVEPVNEFPEYLLQQWNGIHD